MITEIENAIIARITTAQDDGQLGYRLKKIATYGGEFTDGLKVVVRSFPAVWVLYAGQTLQRAMRDSFTFKAMFNVMVASSNMRNEASARHGDANGAVGSYQMVKDMLALVSGQSLGLEIGPFQPERVRALLNDKSDQDLASVYGIEFSTSYTLMRQDDALSVSRLGDFATFNANWDVPAHGNVAKDLPADLKADATDQLSLEQD